MIHNLPPPLVPADVDLRDFKFMPLDVARLRDSDLASDETPEACWAAVLLWCASWHQVPASSIPDSDQWQAKQVGYVSRGRIDPDWAEVKKGALRGWIHCSDGRLYHPVVSEKALDAWRSKLQQRWKSECNRIKKNNQRHNLSLPIPDFESWMSQGCPQGQPLLVPKDSNDVSQGQQPTVPKDNVGLSPTCPNDNMGLSPPCPAFLVSKGQGEGQGQGQGQGQGEVNNVNPNPPVEISAGREVAQGTLPTLDPPADPIPPCPQEKILALYAEILPMLPKPRIWEGHRADLLRTRWRYCAQGNGVFDGYTTQADGIAFWKRFFEYVAKSRKLTEGIPRNDGSVWKPDLPWLLKAENFAKVIEKKYHGS